MLARNLRRIGLPCALLASSALLSARADAQPIRADRLIELDPPLAMSGEHSRIVPLTVSSALVLAIERATDSPMGESSELLLVQRIDRMPKITSLGVRSGKLFMTYGELAIAPKLVRLSATRALLVHPGADGTWDTGDEGVHLLDDLGGSSRVTSLELGRVTIPRLARLDHRTALATVDDPPKGLVLLSQLGEENGVTPLQGLFSTSTPLVLDSAGSSPSPSPASSPRCASTRSALPRSDRSRRRFQSYRSRRWCFRRRVSSSRRTARAPRTVKTISTTRSSSAIRST